MLTFHPSGSARSSFDEPLPLLITQSLIEWDLDGVESCRWSPLRARVSGRPFDKKSPLVMSGKRKPDDLEREESYNDQND
ncbi:MAG: hypothetical protein DME68_07275 [Verrucomicrobia bacterium]|nr:MAG: hypothetical protein DME68_07275 [Verrucomicrobiota bacterium]